MNAANVDRCKIFRRNPSFVDTKKKGMKKADSLSCLRKKLQEIMDKAVPETTKKSQKVRDEII